MLDLKALKQQYQDDTQKTIVHQYVLDNIIMTQLWAYKRYKKQGMSSIDLKTCLVLGLDRLFSQDRYGRERFEDEKLTVYNLNNCMRYYARKEMDDRSYIKTRNPRYRLKSPLYEQETDATVIEIAEWLEDQYGETIRTNCINHYIFGYTFRELDVDLGNSRTTVFRKLDDAWTAVLRYFNINDRIALGRK